MTVQLRAPDVVLRAAATVGEGPVWDARSGRFCWVDLAEGTLFESDIETGDTMSTGTGTLLGAAVPRASAEGFAVAVSDGFGLLVGGVLTVVDPVLPEPGLRMNDGKCDASGRFWAGSNALDFGDGEGRLHVWSNDGPSTVEAEGLTLPNGLGWTADSTTMYLDDSMRRLMLRASFDVHAGTVGAFTTAFDITGGLPDGLAVDVDGCIWVAVWGGSEVRRYRPDGTLDAVIAMPVSQPSSCAFGDDGALYITSASAGIDPAREPLAGSVFALATTTHGVPVAAFAG